MYRRNFHKSSIWWRC